MNYYIDENEWGGYSVAQTKKGWVVSGWTKMQGYLTDWKVLVKPFDNIPHGVDLRSKWSDVANVAEFIFEKGQEEPDMILRTGWRVE